MQRKHYILVKNANSVVLQDRVNRHIEEGYVPYGYLYCENDFYHQVLVHNSVLIKLNSAQ
jgi:hypothetical protein